jgi:hypothetical protein
MSGMFFDVYYSELESLMSASAAPIEPGDEVEIQEGDYRGLKAKVKATCDLPQFPHLRRPKLLTLTVGDCEISISADKVRKCAPPPL